MQICIVLYSGGGVVVYVQYTKLLIYIVFLIFFPFWKLFFPTTIGRSFKNNLLLGTVGVPRGQSSRYYYNAMAPGEWYRVAYTRQMTQRVSKVHTYTYIYICIYEFELKQ